MFSDKGVFSVEIDSVTNTSKQTKINTLPVYEVLPYVQPAGSIIYLVSGGIYYSDGISWSSLSSSSTGGSAGLVPTYTGGAVASFRPSLVSIDNNNNITGVGDITGSGTLGIGSANITGSIGAGSASVTGSIGAGSASITGSISAGSANITGSGSLTVGSGSITTGGSLSAGSATITGSGSLTVGSGSITTGGSLSAGSATITGSGSLTVGSGTVTIGGDVHLTALNPIVGGTELVQDIGSGIIGLFSSSIVFKENINALNADKLLELKPVEFTYINDKQKRKQFGLIAEEVEKVYPELVVYKGDKPFSVNYKMLTPLILQHLSVLQNKITKLEQLLEKK